MKKGFFLLEALLACALLALLVGVVVHHYGQWSRSYKTVVRQNHALEVLMMCIEKKTAKFSDANSYMITKNAIELDAPSGSLASIPSIQCPRPQCFEIIASWREDSQDTQSVSVITGNK